MDELLIKGVADWLSIPVTLAAITVGVIAAAFWLCSRTRSPSLLLERAWRILVGASCSPDREAGKLLQEHQELLEVRFKHVPGLRTHRELLRLRDWLATHNEDIGDIGRCGSFFDTERLKVREDKIPRKWRQMVAFILFVVGMWTSTVLVLLSLSSKPIIILKATSEFVFLTQNSAHSVIGGEIFRKSQCANPFEESETGFNQKEREVLCKLFDMPEAIQHFESGVPIQRAAGIMLAFFIGVFSYTPYQFLRRSFAAKDLSHRLARNFAEA